MLRSSFYLENQDLKEKNQNLRHALEILLSNTRRYLEERPISEREMYDPNYISPIELAEKALKEN